MTDDDISLDEKRVYGTRSGATAVFVATGAGLARVEISDDLVGEFGLVHRGPVTGVAGADSRLAVATDGDVRVGTGEAFAPTGFGPATAVGWHDGLVAAGEGRVARYDAPAAVADDGAGDGEADRGGADDGEADRGGAGDGEADRGGADDGEADRDEDAEGSDAADDDADPAGEWATLAAVEEVRAIDGDTLAARDGVFRLDGTGLGLDDVRDVATGGGVPLAATGDGLYHLGNGWMESLAGEFRAVAAAPDGRAHAATPDDLFARSPAADTYGADAWTTVDLPVGGHVVDVAYAPGATYALTAEGTVLTNAGDGWRDRSLGLPDARGLAVPGAALSGD